MKPSPKPAPAPGTSEAEGGTLRRGPLSDEVVKRGMRLSVLEGIAFAMMVGLSEAFFLADAIRLSASRLEQALVVTVPLFVGSLGPLLGVVLLARMRARKPLVACTALAQALGLAGLSFATYAGFSSPILLIVAATLHGFFGQSGGSAWSSWFGDLVPEDVRGRYFAGRNRWIYGATFAAILTSGLVLNSLEARTVIASDGAGSPGFALIYGLAALFRFGSAALHFATPEPRFGGLTPIKRAAQFTRTASGRGLVRLILANAIFYFAVYVASPYFAPFMLGELHFTYLEYTAATTIVIAVKVLVLSRWGSVVDQMGPRPVFFVAALIVGIIPLPYLWTEGLGWVLVGQALSGLSWAAYELSLFSLLLNRTYRGIRPHVFALQSLLNGAAQLGGSLAGAALLATIPGADLRLIFAFSMGLRVLVALALPVLVPEQRNELMLGRRAVLMRVIGFRPSGGLLMSGSLRVRKRRAEPQDHE
ncbi:Major Facilitator Superfamily protein [Planctomycetes bacterium Poly30]|uniref:Major Facilitator Superfamily protein n=1 Tax=Saltatorellus ferox TaxID=2528018 RepID=A0A518EKS0_9BACT|nr:Major Facilitator Superfamily protein [Planctomycetes bacterium Poly30]